MMHMREIGTYKTYCGIDFNLRKVEWTNQWKFVSCKKCIAKAIENDNIKKTN